MLASAASDVALPAPSQRHDGIAGCPLFPADSVWNTPIDTLPVHPNSAVYINSVGATAHVHADFGSGLWEGGPIGIPYVTVPGSQPRVPISFYYADESDPGPYPVPLGAPIEGGSDRHVLTVQQGTCKLYELYNATPANGRWESSNGAVFDLRSNVLRPAGWTSADAAGLPIFPGLVRYDEVAAGVIRHALRVTFSRTQHGYIHIAAPYHVKRLRAGKVARARQLHYRLTACIDEVLVYLPLGSQRAGIAMGEDGEAVFYQFRAELAELFGGPGFFPVYPDGFLNKSRFNLRRALV